MAVMVFVYMGALIVEISGVKNVLIFFATQLDQAYCLACHRSQNCVQLVELVFEKTLSGGLVCSGRSSCVPLCSICTPAS